MTLPVELLQRRPAPERYDVAVVGAGVGGLVCASILARAGLRVALLERAKRPGGQVQTVAHQGFAVDLGPLLWEDVGFADILAAAGVRELALAELRQRDRLRVAIAQPQAQALATWTLPVPGAVPSPSVLDAVRDLYGIAPRIFAQLGGIYEELAATSVEQLEAWRATTLTAWLAERGTEPVVVAAARRSAELLGALDPEAISLPMLARCAQVLRREPGADWLAPGDNPVSGARGLVQALTDAFIEAGGELRLGMRVLGIAFERSRFRALAVQREEHPFAEEIQADRCILALPASALQAILPHALRAVVTDAVENAPRCGALGMAWGMRGDPSTAREGGSLVRLVSPPRATREPAPPGTLAAPALLVWPTAHAPRIAPPGSALLVAHAALRADAGRDLDEATHLVSILRAAVRELYDATGESILWERHWLKPGAAYDPFSAPKLPANLPGCEGVQLAGADVAAAGEFATGIAAAALSGRAAAEKILAPLAR